MMRKLLIQLDRWADRNPVMSSAAVVLISLLILAALWGLT